ncbi:hypothetical protein BBO99_00008408 [Phytophthora kernoviae]|uniref:Vesicle tethering protein Uso1/P115-like head domain-containing protein n=2 Tax=Phytophthora kernoviae TaxID=325452 RepID=A0A3R7K2B4_9STRA|nr:hypothetical protein G195_009874 [Phytophthora kernoviae 00238/432]KAG2509877.1 hypothetical protein JM16_008592 [Phytophthora kernoviae]KAG2511571.1 hypothetical protein JM18_008684 [Phytophthora kernoviae]RLN45919.1 hypothetical protein BBI17_008595 [Phytophthora kernoviae]RLN75321.1 hypothetical protein BBO99_00008408 [Phytophthora kernoviae]
MEAMLEFLQSLVTRAPSAALLLLEQPQNAATCWGMQTCLTLLQDPSPWIRGPAIALMAYLETHVSRLLRLPGIDGVDEQDDSAALNRRKRVLKLGLQLVRFLVAGLYEGARESSLDELAQRDRARKSQDLNRIQSLVARQEALMGAVDLLRLVSEHNGGVQMILVNLYAWPSGRNVLAELVNVDVGNESDDSPVAAAASALLDALFEENEGAHALVQFQQTPAVLACARASVTQSSRTILAYRAAYDQDAAVEPTEGGDAEAHYLFMLYERSFTAFYREMAERIQKRVIAIYTGVDQGNPASGMDSGSPGADDKAQLERRLEELEAAARAAYEKDQAVLRQRVLEVEQARHAASPTSEGYSDAATDLPSNEGPEQVNTEEDRLKEMVSSQLNELKGLRALVVEMKTVAKEREAQASQATFLQELVSGFDVQTRRDKEKFDATVRELEDELARAFLEKKDAGRKAKAAVKELENEVARLFLAKVELEKELTVHQQGEDGGQSVSDEAIVVNGSRGSVECNASNDSSLDDLLVLVASLEIQCSVLRESLKDAQGEHAVAVAVELSRQRGAVVSV